MFKRFMRSIAVQKTLGFLVAAYMVLIKHTTRWETEHSDVASACLEKGEGLIALTWHSRFMMVNSAWRKDWQTPYALISNSRDGAIVAHATHFLGFKTIRGSSKKRQSDRLKGGTQASRDIRGVIEHGGCVLITPDGPRGPRQRLQYGALRLAKITGSPVLPCTFSVKNRVQFESWDRFVWPLPFGRGKIIWGTPVFVPKDCTEQRLNHLRDRIENEMNIFLSDADRALGHNPVDPAEAIPKNTSKSGTS